MNTIPQGWTIQREGHDVLVSAPGANPGGLHVGDRGPLANRVLHALALALLNEELGSEEPQSPTETLSDAERLELDLFIYSANFKLDGKRIDPRRIQFAFKAKRAEE